MREIVLVADAVHAMILQPIHVLVRFVAAEVLAFVWFVDNDGVLRGDDAGGVLLWELSGLANSLRLGYLVDGELSPVLSGPLLGGMDVEVLEREGDRGGGE